MFQSIPFKWMNRDPEGIAKIKKKERKSRRVGNFEPHDFEKVLGKNINLKKEMLKPVQSINKPLTQLTTSASDMQFSIHV